MAGVSLASRPRQDFAGERELSPSSESVWRYSVRCDRLFAARIERAAGEAGLTVTAFVQAHFDRILDAPEAQAAPGDGFVLDGAADAALARKLRLDPFRARVLRFMRHTADERGLVPMSSGAICAGCNVHIERPDTLLAGLRDAGLIELARRQGGGRPSVWRVLAEV